MHLDQDESIHEALDVVDAEPATHQRQAVPVNTAHAICQQVEHGKCVLVFLISARCFFALKLNPGLQVKQGGQFFAVAAFFFRYSLTVLAIAAATACTASA